MNFPIELPAIRVEQPLGVFYVVTLSAEILLKICYTVETRILEDGNTEMRKQESNTFKTVLNKITGTQRQIKPDRLKEIKEYSETVNASFPNSIILGANFDKEGNLIEDIEEKWIVRKKENSDCYTIIIPSEKKLASVIDGQHRVFAFEKSKSKNMQLLCSIYLDLPLPYHAQMFTTINMNQRSVDKNLTYNLFQFEIDEGNTTSWSPETLAVYLARLLNETDTPLKNKLKIGVEVINENDKLNLNENEQTTISMAAIIDGILSLISIRPKSDRLELHKYTLEEGRTRDRLNRNDLSPLRDLYINNEDRKLYDFILYFITSINTNLWLKLNAKIFTTTLGMQALFDFLKIIITKKNYQELNFDNLLEKTQSINFNDEYFDIQSKARTRLKNTLLIICDIENIESIKIYNEEKEKFYNFLRKYKITS